MIQNTLNNKLPKPVIKSRISNKVVYNNFIKQGMPAWLANILSSRLDDEILVDQLYSSELATIEDPSSIPDMGKAVNRIVHAILNEESIVFACDHDMDGTASAAVLWIAFTESFRVNPDLLSVVTSHRLTEGYGITEPVVERILALKPHLVISADKGSSDEPRIKKLSQSGIDVIVTDHHEIGEDGPPPSAYAVVNPIRSDSSYDRHICGAAVAFLTMAKVRTALLANERMKEIPSLVSLLDYVAVATIADCVSMNPAKSLANRVFVRRGLQLINRRSRVCWDVFCNENQGPVEAETIGFKLAPAVAAAGRLDWAESGFKFLISKTYDDAKIHWQLLQNENTKRKEIEKQLRERAFKEAYKKESQSIVLFFQDGHSGVHGITASRIAESFGKPAGIFSPKGAGTKILPDFNNSQIASGSFRAVPGFHVRDALADVENNYPGLLLGYGGHQGAGGGSILISEFDNFAIAYEESVKKQLGNQVLKPEIWVDGELPNDISNASILEALEKLDPWGRDFTYPTFKGLFKIKEISSLGNGSHLKLLLDNGQNILDAIWFNVVEDDEFIDGIEVGKMVTFLYKLKSNWYRNKKKIQLQIVSIFGNK